MEAMQASGIQQSEGAAHAAASAAATATANKYENAKAENRYPTKQSENRIEHKSFTRMDKFSGGELSYKEWKFNIEITVESICPGPKALLNGYLENPQEEEPRYEENDLEHAII